MDKETLAALKELVSPIILSGALTLELAAAAMKFNECVAHFHGAVVQAEQALEVDGFLDPRLGHELIDRAARLALVHDRLVKLVPPPMPPRGAALVPA